MTSIDEQLQECAKISEEQQRKIAEQERIIGDQCDTIIDLIGALDARDVQ